MERARRRERASAPLPRAHVEAARGTHRLACRAHDLLQRTAATGRGGRAPGGALPQPPARAGGLRPPPEPAGPERRARGAAADRGRAAAERRAAAGGAVAARDAAPLSLSPRSRSERGETLRLYERLASGLA